MPASLLPTTFLPHRLRRLAPAGCTASPAAASSASAPSSRYDFDSLLDYLSSPSVAASLTSSSPPASVPASERRLAASYSAVPSHEWHALLRDLAASDASLPLAFALLPFLHRHRLCFPLDLLLSSLLNSLSVSGRLLPHSLLLSFPPSLTEPPSPLLLNSLLAASAAASRPAVALRLLSLLREHDFLPDLASYSHLLASLLNTKDPPDAALLERLLDDLRESRLEPDAPLFSDLISAFARAALPDAALELLADRVFLLHPSLLIPTANSQASSPIQNPMLLGPARGAGHAANCCLLSLSRTARLLPSLAASTLLRIGWCPVCSSFNLMVDGVFDSMADELDSAAWVFDSVADGIDSAVPVLDSMAGELDSAANQCERGRGEQNSGLLFSADWWHAATSATTKGFRRQRATSTDGDHGEATAWCAVGDLELGR